MLKAQLSPYVSGGVRLSALDVCGIYVRSDLGADQGAQLSWQEHSRVGALAAAADGSGGRDRERLLPGAEHGGHAAPVHQPGQPPGSRARPHRVQDL